MSKLRSWIKSISKLLFVLGLASIFGLCTVNGMEKRFDFEVHKMHFLRGEYKVSTKYGKQFHVSELTFEDGCAVKFNIDDSGRATKWRWSKRNIHGLLMSCPLKFEKT